MNYEERYKELVGKMKKAYLYAQTDSTRNGRSMVGLHRAANRKVIC